ncbi:protein serine/threonine phosphatase 2C [Coprinopsis marcescibilis]|uniref:Protein serine/threonine phosphatase 2C n=1 Tax=Coprinopsis marcescibilis TaxID=230819 RepID=A0A5C3L954_COPMA|nr:protein serine/threonine phosphatase 2C [Coprinopsis marcescibilis]
MAQYQPTKRPIEDRYSVHFDEARDRLILGVYDGHGGTSAAEYVSEELPAQLLQEPPSAHTSVFQQMDDSMVGAFLKDHSVMRIKSDQWIQHAQNVRSGCTALVCDIDLRSLAATVSNAGDCRLVVCHLDRKEPQKPMSVRYETLDLNAKTPSEQERIKTEHPNEDSVIVGGRLFGKLMSTRGFGDGYYKFPLKGMLGKWSHRRYIDALSEIEQPGKVPMNAQYDIYFDKYQTPPYVTARPESGTITILPSDVMILASDGLWDLISSQELALLITEIHAQASGNSAVQLLQRVMDAKSPGDDVTILIFQTEG